MQNTVGNENHQHEHCIFYRYGSSTHWTPIQEHKDMFALSTWWRSIFFLSDPLTTMTIGHAFVFRQHSSQLYALCHNKLKRHSTWSSQGFYRPTTTRAIGYLLDGSMYELFGYHFRAIGVYNKGLVFVPPNRSPWCTQWWQLFQGIGSKRWITGRNVWSILVMMHRLAKAHLEELHILVKKWSTPLAIALPRYRLYDDKMLYVDIQSLIINIPSDPRYSNSCGINHHPSFWFLFNYSYSHDTYWRFWDVLVWEISHCGPTYTTRVDLIKCMTLVKMVVCHMLTAPGDVIGWFKVALFCTSQMAGKFATRFNTEPDFITEQLMLNLENDKILVLHISLYMVVGRIKDEWWLDE